MVLLLRLSILMRRFYHTVPTAPLTRFGIGYIQESPFQHSLYPETGISHRNIFGLGYELFLSFFLSVSFWILYFGWNIYDAEHLKQPRNDSIIVLAAVVVME